jgi:spore protease
MYNLRTDIAAEAHQIWRERASEATKLDGVIAESRTERGYFVERVQISTAQGSDALNKPIGSYVTLGLDALHSGKSGAFADGAELFGQLLAPMFDGCDSVLVVGLGNSAITSDSLGPLTALRVIATRHLSGSSDLNGMRNVSVLQPGVAGTTGIESGELIKAAADALKPDCVIAVDALASAKLNRVCRTVQLADSGITPGSGIGNARKELSARTLGVPVIAVGVPTMVYAATLLSDVADAELPGGEDMVVTPKDIDAKMKELSRFLAYGINLALHNGLNMSDLQDLMS